MNEQSAAHIREFRKAKGWTQQQMAVQMGVAVATVTRWERGQTVPSGLALIQLTKHGYKE